MRTCVGTRNHPNISQQPYFVTFATWESRPVFQDPAAARFFVEELRTLRSELGFLLLGYVVMSDHVHLIVVPGLTADLGKVMQYVKGRFARRYNERTGGVGKFWQDRYYESIIRDEAWLVRRMQYVEANPVTAGLVSEPEEYPFSAAVNGRDDLESYVAPRAIETA